MALNQAVVSFALASAVATSGTVTVGYPVYQAATIPNLTQGNFNISDSKHTLKIGNNIYSSPQDFTLTFNANASGITVTNRGTTTWPAGSVAALGLNTNGNTVQTTAPRASTRVVPAREIILDLGSPAAAAATTICAAQAIASATNAVINGTLAIGGVGFPDVPRGLSLVSSNAGDTTQTVTITGLDEWGQTVVETATLNGTTTVNANKAFAAVTRVAVSAAMTGNLSVGSSTKLGLPLAVRNVTQVRGEALDAAVATAGTFAYALSNTVPSATNGDVRGTYIPNSAPDGSRAFKLTVSLPDPSDIGVAQFAG